MPSLFCRVVALAVVTVLGDRCLQAQGNASVSEQRSECLIPDEEREVLADFLKLDAGSSGLRVVRDETKPSRADVDYFNLQMALKGHAIPPDLRKDFKNKDKSPCAVPSFTGVARVVFISEARENAIFRDDQKGWKFFHRTCGQRASMVAFSRVGFSSDRQLALLQVSSAIGGMAAAGELYLLERRSNRWVVKYSIWTWTT